MLILMVALANCLAASNGLLEHRPCMNDNDCNPAYTRSICNNQSRRCECLSSHPVVFKGYSQICVKSSRVGEYCEFSDSCRHYDPNTICTNKKKCKCESGYHLRKRRTGQLICLNRENYLLDSEAVSDFSDEDDDDSSEEEDDVKKSYEHEFVVPVIVGIVLGTIIVCAWSFAICRLYLKKMERQGRMRRKRTLKRIRCTDKSTSARPPPEVPRLPLNYSPGYSLVPSAVEPPVFVDERSHPCDLSFDTSIPEDCSLSRSPSPPQCAIPLFSPDEEPLPGYDMSPSKESVCAAEAPPSYHEVMNGEGYEADHQV